MKQLPNDDLGEALSAADESFWVEQAEGFEDLLDCIELLREVFSGRPGRWAKRAACKGLDINVFYPGAGRSTKEAAAVCARCPVRDECEQHALSLAPGTVGIFAGQSTIARDAARRSGQTAA